jgi:hypothetical protein
MTTTETARPYVSPKLLRPLREWSEVWHARLESEAARMEKESDNA